MTRAAAALAAALGLFGPAAALAQVPPVGPQPGPQLPPAAPVPGPPQLFAVPPPPAPYPPPPRPADPFESVPTVRAPGGHGGTDPSGRRPPEHAPGYHLHDGFYLRVGLGLSIVRETIKSEGQTFAAAGGGLPLDLALGGSPADGFVLGGGLFLLGLGDRKRDPVPLGADVDPNAQYSATLAMFGPFFDWYPDPQDGLHFGATIAFANVGIQPDAESPYNPTGGGGVIGVGKEWWIGGQTSMGVAARLTAAWLRDDLDGVRYVQTVLGFGAQATFTFQ